MNLPALQINNIFKSFRDKEVLEDISFSVKEGEIFGFIGLNGVGKTTLIKIILDLLDCDSGEIEIFGKDHGKHSSRKNLSYLPEKFQPSSNIIAGDFIKLNLGLHHVEFNLEEVKKLCDNLDLDSKYLNMKISKFSKGMMQKLGLISTFLSKRKLIILDEPMSGLDPKSRINLKKQLLSYKNLGNSIFFSSHILSDIDEICDKIAILNNKKILFLDSPEKLKKEYSTNNLEQAFISKIL